MSSPTSLHFARVTIRQTLVSVAILSATCVLGITEPANGQFDERLLAFIGDHCLACHDSESRAGGLGLDAMLTQPIAAHAQQWEHVVRRLRTRQMPPLNEDRPSEQSYKQAILTLVTALDRYSQDHLNPGRVPSLRRLNRTEYQNAVRDLLGIEVDVKELLPRDDAGHGFDNITVTDLSPALLDRYIAAAQKISRLAVGASFSGTTEKTYRVRPDLTQDAHLPGTPIGTRGGLVVQHYFQEPGTYELQVRLMRDRNEELEGQPGEYELEIIVDRDRVGHFPFVRPSRGANDRLADANLTVSFFASAGSHEIGAVFLPRGGALLESVRQPLNVHYNFYRHPRLEPAVYQFTIRGPLQVDTQSTSQSTSQSSGPRRHGLIFTHFPKPDDQANASPLDEDNKTQRVTDFLKRLMRRAYRREVQERDLELPLRRFHAGQAEFGFEAGIERAVATILSSPHFLFHIEPLPSFQGPRSVVPVSPAILASRLSFFLWSSLPDEELLDLARTGELSQQHILKQQVIRMLQDNRSDSLTMNFAAQWLFLRNLDSFVPDMRLYPDFDDNLRQSLRKETELLFCHVVRNDLSVLRLIDADFTFCNERLAKHYGIPHIYGSRFRQVSTAGVRRRGGLLRQGSILCVTSYANRTSPVIRGTWVLENLLGSPPPPPPPDVPNLQDDAIISASLSVRERLEQHRANPTCAQCHDMIDPIGFALENFDAVGRWRSLENGQAISTETTFPDGATITGVSGLERYLLDHPELFVQTLIEKLMAFGLGRGLGHYDAAAVRQVLRDSKESNYRFSDIVIGIVNSVPFQMRTVP